jgi:enoyl-CoA hydratase
MSDPEILVEIEDRVLFVVLNRPAKRNALSRSLLGKIRTSFEQAKDDTSLVAAVLRGAEDKSFAAGGDLHDLSEIRTEEGARRMALDARAALDAIRSFPVPVIAGLNGDALGGGAELAASCDFRVAAAHARIGFIQGRLAIPTAWGGAHDLVAILGPTKALRLLARAEVLESESAAALGLFDAVASPGENLNHAIDTFLAPLREQAPQVLRAFKAVNSVTADRTLGEAMELDFFAKCWAHADHWAAHDRVLSRQR